MNGEHEFYCAECGHLVLSLKPEEEAVLLASIDRNVSGVSTTKVSEEARTP